VRCVDGEWEDEMSVRGWFARIRCEWEGPKDNGPVAESNNNFFRVKGQEQWSFTYNYSCKCGESLSLISILLCLQTYPLCLFRKVLSTFTTHFFYSELGEKLPEFTVRESETFSEQKHKPQKSRQECPGRRRVYYR
jgi:hypothetical protein